MNKEDSKIETRLGDVLNSILCPLAGCWSLHGGHSEYYFDPDAESHVLEVRPVGIEEKNGCSLLVEAAEEGVWRKATQRAR